MSIDVRTRRRPLLPAALSLAAMVTLPVIGSLALTSPPAGAQPPLPVPGAPMQVTPALARAVPATTVGSSNWSGYAVSGSTYTKVSTTVVVPRLTCSSEETAAGLWVGLDGYENETVEQTGVTTACIDDEAYYLAWYETYPDAPVYYESTVAPGNVLKESVTANTATSFTLSITDVTEGWSHSTTRTVAAAQRASAEVIVEAPSNSEGVVPLADFGTTAFTKAKVDGTAIGNLDPVTIDMVSGSTQEDAVSALTKGKNFSVTWLAS
jgi:hypothetical protein